MSESEKEMLALLADLVRATKEMHALVSEMSARLDRNAQVQVHVNGKVPTPPIPNSPSFGMDLAKCGKCGLKMEGVMGYVCPNGGSCPTGLGGSVSMAA
ncbi:hypothetical protein [Paraburkholderia caledonica]|uniref:Uncharacterized protein n=1 Tax=Paraburkholderia caledonica TaxID=134536 RepID=A0AB73IPW5_9BURK|nr:hypothetical protein [Paraburkholderia caledonica]